MEYEKESGIGYLVSVIFASSSVLLHTDLLEDQLQLKILFLNIC